MSGRLRAGGALLLLLGGVGVADRWIGLSSGGALVERPPLVFAGILITVGAAMFALGRRWM